jgi:flagellar motility protein MotE (MotC chaperone)
MKSVLILSSVTFLLIFGGIAVMAVQLSGRMAAPVDGDPVDAVASERLLRDASLERDRLQREAERVAGLQQSQAAREAVMADVHASILGVIDRLEARQGEYVQEQDAAADRLAKMYEAMKADKAASILSTMDLDVVLSIMSRMKERQAAQILSYMDPGMAARLSTRLSMQGGA